MLKVDVFMPKGRPFDREALRRVRPESLEEGADSRKYLLASPEDVVLAKLEWYRAGGETSERPWTDVVGVLKTIGATLERDYLFRNAAALGVSDLLTRAFKNAGLTPSGT
jgi:hypothetical protein